MQPSEYWQNFELGKEIEISCGFLYDGLRNLHEMESLEFETEIFSVLYNLAVGLERFSKVAIILLEYTDDIDPEEFEKSLITHNHLELLNRVKKIKKINLAKQHNEFVALLAEFYNSFRYDRYSLKTTDELSKEKEALLSFLTKYIDIDVSPNIFGETSYINTWKVKKFIGKLVCKLIEQLYEIIWDASHNKNIFTYEIRHNTKAYKLIYGKEYDFLSEDILWKELLIFILSNKDTSNYLEYIENISPLEFDIALLNDYLQALGSDIKKISVTEELDSLYENIENKKERIEALSLIGDPSVYFGDDDE